MQKEIPPLRWIVRDLLPEGLTILAGNPKSGKSFLALNIGLAVATGGMALGSISVEQGEVLYGAFEDGERRLQARISQMLADDQSPSTLHFRLELPPLTGKNRGDVGEQGAEDKILQHLQRFQNTRLVVLDVLGRIRRSGSRNDPMYQVETDLLARLQQIAVELQIAILVLHHRRKERTPDDPFADASGTYGLTGVADTVIILDRDPKRERGALLHVTGRDVETESFAIERINTGGWRIVGKAAELASTKEQQEILCALEELGGQTTTVEISKFLGISPDAARKRLSRLERTEKIMKVGRGVYMLSGRPQEE